MNCPKCKSSQLEVIDSRERPRDNARYRRRLCLECGFRFSTIEAICNMKGKAKEMKMKVVLDPGAKMPTRAHETDAGLDLYSTVDTVLPVQSTWTDGSVCIDTGVHIEIPAGYVGFLKSKSGLNVKSGIQSEGVIDAGYTGSIMVKLYNHSKNPVPIQKGQKISQLVLLPIISPELELVDSLEETDRGNGGFGSTGAF